MNKKEIETCCSKAGQLGVTKNRMTDCTLGTKTLFFCTNHPLYVFPVQWRCSIEVEEDLNGDFLKAHVHLTAKKDD
jgi:hypothetical protein